MQASTLTEAATLNSHASTHPSPRHRGYTVILPMPTPSMEFNCKPVCQWFLSGSSVPCLIQVPSHSCNHHDHHHHYNKHHQFNYHLPCHHQYYRQSPMLSWSFSLSAVIANITIPTEDHDLHCQDPGWNLSSQQCMDTGKIGVVDPSLCPSHKQPCCI